ncbi:MAG: hypothetical protein EBE86_015275 [Hormoscilla sp. GUM202]|nr:hypothetical protein [Hormoscilla sp. GUM202]
MLWFGYQQIKSLLRPPQAMLVLGSTLERERFAAEFARDRPDVQNWVSGGSNREYAQWLFADRSQRRGPGACGAAMAGVDLERLHLDYRATDKGGSSYSDQNTTKRQHKIIARDRQNLSNYLGRSHAPGQGNWYDRIGQPVN